MLLFAVCSSGRAEIITIGIEGIVDSVDDSYNLLESEISAGDTITGWYIYDSETPDLEPSTYNGIYEHTTTPYGFSLTIGNLTFQTDPTDVDFVIGIENNYYGGPWDYYTVTSSKNLPLDNGVSVDNLHWQLDDYPGTAISSDELTIVPPHLSKWKHNNRLSILGGQYPFPSPTEKTLFGINGHVTSDWLIPEPATLLLFGLGGLFLRKRNLNIL